MRTIFFVNSPPPGFFPWKFPFGSVVFVYFVLTYYSNIYLRSNKKIAYNYEKTAKLPLFHYFGFTVFTISLVNKKVHANE